MCAFYFFDYLNKITKEISVKKKIHFNYALLFHLFIILVRFSKSGIILWKSAAKVKNYITKITLHFWHLSKAQKSCRQSRNILELYVENILEYTGISKNSGIFSTFSTYVESFGTFGFGLDGKSTSKVGIIFEKISTIKSTVRYIFRKSQKAENVRQTHGLNS